MRILKSSYASLRLLPPAALLGIFGSAHADTGVGVDTWRANKLDPTGGTASWHYDENGTSWLYPGEQRTPTGNLYLCPKEPPQTDRQGDWDYSGVLQLGYQGVSGDSPALWNRFAAWDPGALLGLLDLNLEHPSDGSYAEVRASRISDEDQYYQAVYGKAGAYKIQAFYRDVPNVLSTDAHILWNGAGTNALTLPSSLTPGGSTVAQVAAASAATPTSTLKVTRSKEGLNLSTYLSPQWTAYADFTDEQRKGTRPYGGTFFFAFAFPNDGGVLETVKPIDDSTINIDGGLRYAGQEWRMDFSYSGSFYRDHYTAYYFQSPFALYPVVPGAVSAPLYQGQMSTEPDNEYHNVQTTLTRKIAMNGELSISGAVGRMLQNDQLIPPIDCQGVVGMGLGNLQPGPQNPFLVSCSNWNTTAALSRQTADMRIDTSMADARIVLRPSTSWTVRGGLKLDRQDYPDTYVAYNPLTGQYGYISENGSQGSIVPGEIGFVDPNNSAEPTRIRSLPLDTRTIDANLGADWKLSERNTLGATFDHNRYEPTHRERTQVNDSSVKLSWTNRSIDWLTLRVNYAYLRQTGDAYNDDPYDFLYSNSLPGYVPPPTGTPAHTVDAERKYDLSGRDENKVDVMVTIMPREDMTMTASLRGDWNNYDAVIGRTGYDTVDATLQFEWQPAAGTSASAYIASSRSRLGFSNVQDQQSGAGIDPTFGGANYALDGQWWLRDAQRDYNGGVIVSHVIRRARVDLTWNYIYSRGVDDYSYAGSSALAYPTSVASTGAGGGAFPGMTYRVNSFTASLTVPLTDRLSVHLFDYYELGRISDWHYAGFDEGLVVGNRVYTDAGPQNYAANVIGVLFNLRL
jgi:hypothetical protein